MQILVTEGGSNLVFCVYIRRRPYKSFTTTMVSVDLACVLCCICICIICCVFLKIKHDIFRKFIMRLVDLYTYYDSIMKTKLRDKMSVRLT